MVRPLVAEWRATDATDSVGTVLLEIGVRPSDGKIAVAAFQPSLDRELGEPIAVILLSGEEAAGLLDRLMQGLDQTGDTEKVNRKLSARERALSER
jgi:hypothetical protein